MSSLAGVRVLAKLIHSATIGSTFSRMKSASRRSPAEAGFGNGGLVNAISFWEERLGANFRISFLLCLPLYGFWPSEIPLISARGQGDTRWHSSLLQEPNHVTQASPSGGHQACDSPT